MGLRIFLKSEGRISFTLSDVLGRIEDSAMVKDADVVANMPEQPDSVTVEAS